MKVSLNENIRYRFIPIAYALNLDHQAVKRCNHGKGHVLKLERVEGEVVIVCNECPAQWRNEGF